MAKDFNVILGEAQQIKNEIIEGANTANRLGTCLEDIVQRAEVDEAAAAKTTTEIVAGDGLTGGGTIAQSRTLSVGATNDSVIVGADGIKVDTQDSLTSTSATKPLSAKQGKALQDNKADKSRKVNAGAGLTGGGDLDADRTIDVVSANDGITVNADNIQLNTIDNVTSTYTTKPLSANQGKVLNDKVVQVETDLNDYYNTSQSNIESIGGITEAEGTQIDITWTDGYYLPKAVVEKIPASSGSSSISQMIELTLGKKYFIKTSLYELYDVAVFYYNSAEISAGNYVGKGGYTLDDRSQATEYQFLLTPPSTAAHMVVSTRSKTAFQLIEVTQIQTVSDQIQPVIDQIQTVSDQIQPVIDQIQTVSDQIPGAPINILYKKNKGAIYVRTSDYAVQLVPLECVSYIIQVDVEIGDVVSLKSYLMDSAPIQLSLTNYEPQDIVSGTIIPKRTASLTGVHNLTADIPYKYAIVSSRKNVNLTLAQNTIDNAVLTVNNILPTDYIDNHNFIRESDLTQELQNKINEPIIDLPDWVGPNKPNYTASEVGAVAKSQGSYNAGKNLVVGLDGTVGIGEIEQGVNANIEYVRNEKQNILYLSDNIADIDNSVIPENCVRVNNEFVLTNLTSGQKIIIPTTCLQGRKYFVRLTVSEPKEGLVYTVLGNKHKIDMYNGAINCFSGFIADGNNSNLEVQFNGNRTSYTLSEVKIQELVTPEISTDSFVYQFGNVTAGSFSATDICSYWNAVPSMQSTMNKAECVTRNVALGYCALLNLITGTRTVAIGSFSGSALKHSDRNIIIGSDALWQTEEAVDNVVIGKAALGKMKRIGGVLTMGVSNYNVAIGSDAMTGSGMSDDGLELYTPEYNVAIGYQAGFLTKNGSVCIGHAAGYGRGIGEVAIGKNSGSKSYDLPTNCICIGTNSGYNLGSSSSDMKQIVNSIVIGYNAKSNKSNQIVIGNSSITEVIIANKKIFFNDGGTVTWETI